MSELRLSGNENFISSAEIRDRTQELGRYFTELYDGEPVYVISLLEGAKRFGTHLGEAIDNPNMIEGSLRTQSMDGVQSLGTVTVEDRDFAIEDMSVLVAEDIDDKRITLSAVASFLRGKKPKRLDLACLFNKPTAQKITNILPFDDIQYGFNIENRFVVGHGLDWNGRYRALQHVSVAHNIADPHEPELWVPMVPDEYKIAA